MSTRRFCVVYRTGGTERFDWHRSIPLADKAEALTLADVVTHQGYLAYVECADPVESVEPAENTADHAPTC